MKFLLNCLCIMIKLHKSCSFKGPLSRLQKYVQIAVCAIDRKQRRKSMGGVFVGLPIINISWSTNTIHAQIQLEKTGWSTRCSFAYHQDELGVCLYASTYVQLCSTHDSDLLCQVMWHSRTAGICFLAICIHLPDLFIVAANWSVLDSFAKSHTIFETE